MGPLTTPCICTPQASCLLLVKLRSVWFFFFSNCTSITCLLGKKKSKSYTDEQREEIALSLSPKESHCNPLVCVLTDVCVWTCLCCASQEERGKDGKQTDFSILKEKRKCICVIWAALGLCCCERPFSGCGEPGLFSSHSAQASHCSFSRCGAQALVAPCHVTSSWTRD